MAVAVSMPLTVPSPLSVAMPLPGPSVEAAMAFLTDLVPASVFSQGTRRRRPVVATASGSRSDTGYITFYQQRNLDGDPELQPLKALPSIRAYLERQVSAPPADHWVALQISLFRSGRKDGHSSGVSIGADLARHILAVVVDLDGARMVPMYQGLLQRDFYAFRAVLDERLTALGITRYHLVRSGPTGVHLYLPLIGPGGRPLRASRRTMATWRKVAEGVHRYLADFGADPNTIRPTQPYAIPGLPRLKHAGFVPYVAGGRDGERADLFALLRRLRELRLLWRTRLEIVEGDAPDPLADLTAWTHAIKTDADGVAQGGRFMPGRNLAAYQVAVSMLAKGATANATWEAMQAWNERNRPPLSLRELRTCFHSALRCRHRSAVRWEEMAQAPWNGLRTKLGLPVRPARWYRDGGRWRPITPAKSWEVRKLWTRGREHYGEVAERLMSHLEGSHKGVWESTQGEIAQMIGTAVSTLKEVLKGLQAAGRLRIETKRGRGGKTVLYSESCQRELNSQCRKAPIGVKKGEWAGPAEQGQGACPVVPALPGLCASVAAPAGSAVRLAVSESVGATAAGRVTPTVGAALSDSGETCGADVACRLLAACARVRARANEPACRGDGRTVSHHDSIAAGGLGGGKHGGGDRPKRRDRQNDDFCQLGGSPGRNGEEGPPGR